MSALDPRLNAFRADLADGALEGRVAAARFTPGRPRMVSAPCAPLRREPRAAAPLDTELCHGEDVLVFEEREGWAWLRSLRDSYVGYAPAAALGARTAPCTHRLAANASFVFPAPDIKAPPLMRLTLGARLAISREEGDFAVRAEGGFVWRGHLGRLEDREGDWVLVAERLIGTPYLWGGRSPDGIDCSGLVQIACEAAGIACPRDSDMQAASLGQPLGGEAELRRGDLVFWKGHVGILRNSETLLHANAHHLAVASEPLAGARARIAAAGSPVTVTRRLVPAR